MVVCDNNTTLNCEMFKSQLRVENNETLFGEEVSALCHHEQVVVADFVDVLLTRHFY